MNELNKRSGRVGKKPLLKAGKSSIKKAAATVVFVPSTKGSTLLMSMREDEDKMADMTGFRVKYQEAGGSVLTNIFNKDLARGQHCGRTSCPPCDQSEKRENCRSKNIVYESKCKICNPTPSREEDDDHPSGRDNSTPREGIYIGESSRSLHERAVEHVRDAENFSPKSYIMKHWMSKHPDIPSPPQMEFTARYRDCLSRQIGEALRINYSKDNILNSKSEYLQNKISRLTIEEDAWERRERSRLEVEEDKLDKERVEAF